MPELRRDRDWPAPTDLLGRLLSELVGEPVADVTSRLLSSGLSRAGVFRVGYATARGGVGSVVLKVPALHSTSGVENADPDTLDRERLLLEAGFSREIESLARGRAHAVRVPRLLALTINEGRAWIWMDDLGHAFGKPWLPDRAVDVARLAAAVPELAALPSVTACADRLARREYAAYAQHVPLCRRNLAQVAASATPVLPVDDVETALRLLERTPWALAELDRRPAVFCHGDLNPHNIGEGWIVTDWASAGWAPAGSDLATFLSTYEVFGGRREGLTRRALTEALVNEYVVAVASRDPALTAAAVNDVLVLWWLTWGLHLRLGPGLRSALDLRTPEGEAEGILADIRAGLEDCRTGLALFGEDPVVRP